MASDQGESPWFLRSTLMTCLPSASFRDMPRQLVVEPNRPCSITRGDAPGSPWAT